MDSSNVSASAYVTIFAFLFSIFAVLLLLLWLTWSKEGKRGSVSPYTGSKMRFGVDIAKSIQMYVQAFLQDEQQPENPPIDFTTAAVCSDTGRIFPNCVTPGEHVVLDWEFIKKRVDGVFISWGALSEHEQAVIKLLHGTVEGFQTEQSSQQIRPEKVEREYARLAPGPLYVDRKTKILVGWKKVPGTTFEVLVVQKPMYESIEQTL